MNFGVCQYQQMQYACHSQKITLQQCRYKKVQWTKLYISLNLKTSLIYQTKNAIKFNTL